MWQSLVDGSCGGQGVDFVYCIYYDQTRPAGRISGFGCRCRSGSTPYRSCLDPFACVEWRLFFAIALLIAILINSGSQTIRWHPVRYSIALLACVPAYILVVFASASMSQYLAGILRLAPTANLEDGRSDMAFGVLIASWLAGFFIEILIAVLTGSWSWRSLGICLLIGSAAVMLSLLVNAPYHGYWIFVGTLLVTSEALFMWQVGHRLGTRAAI